MAKALRLLFNLHPGEGRKAALFIILGLLWSVGSYGSFVLSEGMFLERVGAQALPNIYFAIALALCLLSTLLIFALNRFSLRSLLFFTIALWITCNLGFFFLYPLFSQSTAFWYLYKAVGWIIPISTYIVYWAFVDQYYDLQDGKRFFCLFNSTTFLGDALGGGLIAYSLDFLGIRGLIFLFIAAMIASLPFIFIITKKLTPALEAHVESIDATSSLDFKSLFKTVFHSKFTFYLLCFYFFMQLLAIVTEFSYMDTIDQHFSGAPENALTEFNGRMGMLISLCNMVFGLFAYSRLVKKMGINNIIVIAPLFFLAVFSFWFFKDVLAIAIFGMIAREGVVYSFDDNNLNLLISGVPTKIKNQVRIAVESFIEPVGMFAAASLLLFFKAHSHFLGLLLSFIALGAVLFLRTSYPRAIFKNLVATSIRFEMKAKEYLNRFSKKELKKTEFWLLSNLKLGSEKSQLIAYEYLLRMGDIRTLPRLLNHIGKLSLPGKLKAIELLSESSWAKEGQVLERLERWRRSLPHPAIKSSIHFYLARHGLLRPERICHDLQSEHLGLRAAAILTFKTSAHAFQFPSFCSLASEKLKLLLDSQVEQEICLALEILGFEKKYSNIEILFPYLKHSSLQVNKAAAKAMSFVAHPDYSEYSEALITYLSRAGDSEIRLNCLQTLEKLAKPKIVRKLILAAAQLKPNEHKYVERIVLGMPEAAATIPLLIQMVQDRRICDKCRLLAGKILGKQDRKALQKRVFQIIKLEIERAFFYFFHAHTIQRQVPEHDLSILKQALLTGYHSIIDFIIQLLGVAGSLEECEVLSHTLHSQNRKIRAQAIESLEKTCDARIYALLEPLIDESHPEVKINRFLKGGGIPLNLTQLLEAMKHSPSKADQIISLAMKTQLKTPDWRTNLKEKLEGNEDIFHHLANELLEEHA